MSRYYHQAAEEVRKNAFKKMYMDQQAEREDADRKHQAALDRLEQTYQAALNRLGSNYQAALDQLGRHHQSALNRLAAQHRERTAEIQNRQQAEARELEAALENPSTLLPTTNLAIAPSEMSKKRDRPTNESPGSGKGSPARKRDARGQNIEETVPVAGGSSALRDRRVSINSFIASPGGLSDEEYRICDTILSKIRSPELNHINRIFLEPSEIAERKDSTAVIERPMDLRTMATKLAKSQYGSLGEFTMDFDLIVSNCYLCNSENSPPYKMAEALEEKVNELWKEYGLVEAAGDDG